MEVQVNKIDLKKMMSLMRQDIRKGFCSMQDACYILDVKRDTFYALLKDPDTKIRKTAIQGKYLIKSIDAEVERLTL